MEDAVIIGGGVIGAAVLYYLAQNGMQGTLLEKRELASGSSGKCDGNIQCGDTKAGVDLEFVRMGQKLFSQAAGKLRRDIQWKEESSLMVFETEEENEAGKTFVKEQLEKGLRIRYLDRKELLACEPKLAPDLAGGCQFDGDGRVNPMLLTIGLAEEARRLGASVREREQVIDICQDSGSGLYTVRTQRETYVSPIVINAAGVWAPEIGAFLGVSIPIVPRQGQVLVTEAEETLTSQTVTEFGYLMTKYGKSSCRRNVTPEMEEFGVAMVLEPTEAGNYLVGSSRRFCGFDMRTDARVVKALAQRTMRFFPGIQNLSIIRTYAGLRPYTEDQRAIICETERKGFYVAAGHEGGGITQSLATGKLMSELILKQPFCIDPAPFSLKRFEKK